MHRACRFTALAVCGVACIILSAAASFAATPASSSQARSKFGLVLSGGGALGLAHIGVLEWLEEHHIPVDDVAGTSMGALVGAAYATGESPEQIRALVEDIDWNQILSDAIPYRDLSFRRKEDAGEYPMYFQFGIKHGLRPRTGYKSGQQVQFLLDKIVLPYSEVHDFNHLPIPFACVATDLVSGKAHVFRSGQLSTALRATMSLPGIFAPVKTPDGLYADGGLLDNMPVDVARQMGADITVAVTLQAATITHNDRLSSIGVLGRSISVMIAANELKSMERADVLISVPLQDYSTLGYDRVKELIRKGYEATQSKAAILEKLALDDAAWQQYLQERSQRIRSVPVPQFVRVQGVPPLDAKQIEIKLAPDLQKPVQPEKIARELSTIASDQRVSNLNYGMTANSSGVPGIAVDGEADPYFRNTFHPLILVDGWDYKNVTLSVGGRITYFDFGRYGAELRTDILFGSEYRLSSEYYVPFFAKRRWFAAPRLLGSNAPLNIYDDNGLIAEYRNRILGGGGIGYEFGRSAELRIGYESGVRKLYPNIGDPTLYPRINGREGDTHVRFALEQLDDPITPLRGWRVLSRTEWWDAKPAADEEFPLAELSVSGFRPLTSKSSAYLVASGGSTLWKNPDGLPPFSLGGSFRLPAYNTNELLTNQYFLFQGGYVRKLGALSPLAGGKILLFAGVDVGKAYYVQNASHLPSDGAGGLIINTLLGPVVVGAAFGDAGHYKVFFEVGRAYF